MEARPSILASNSTCFVWRTRHSFWLQSLFHWVCLTLLSPGICRWPFSLLPLWPFWAFLLWIQRYKCPFKLVLSCPLDKCPRVVPYTRKVILYLSVWRLSTRSSMGTARSTFQPLVSQRAFICILTETCYFLFCWWRPFPWVWVGILLWIWHDILQRWVEWSISSYMCRLCLPLL